jgi:hypothetical protein
MLVVRYPIEEGVYDVIEEEGAVDEKFTGPHQ